MVRTSTSKAPTLAVAAVIAVTIAETSQLQNNLSEGK